MNFQLYNKSLKDWSLGKQLILFPSNLGFTSGNLEILGKQNELFPEGPVMKWLLFPQSTDEEGQNEYLTLTEKSLKKKENLSVLEYWELNINLL